MGQLMGIKRLQFRTTLDTNGNSLSLVIDVENKLFSWGNHYYSSDFYKVSRKDIRAMRERLKWLGFKEVD